MDSNIITQSVLQSVQFALQQDMDNLAAHANMLMSRAHGWNMLWLLPGTTDANGNLIDQYYDDHGNALGTYFLVIPSSDQENIFYAPARDTTLAGQPAATGSVDPGYGVPLGTGTTQDAWITQLDESSVDSNAINDTLLGPHSMLGFWEVHGAVTVWSQATYDSTGNQIGTHVAAFYFNGVQYLIPCTPRIGGMMERLNIPPLTRTVQLLELGSRQHGAGADLGLYCTPAHRNTFTATYTGTAPFTVVWQALNYYGTWTDLSTSGYVATSTDANIGFNYSIIGETFTLISMHTTWFDNAIESLSLRYQVTSSATNQTATSQTFTFTLHYIHDNGDGCWFCSQADKAQPLSPDDWKIINQLHVACFKAAPRLTTSYSRHGRKLVARMLKNGVTSEAFVNFVQETLKIARTQGINEAVQFYGRWLVRQINTHWPPESSSCEIFHRQMRRNAEEIARFS